MTNPVHLLSVASLLLVAFLVGAIVGTLLRLIALRVARKPAAVAAAAVETSMAAAPLVTTPIIAPLPIAPTPTAPSPADVPVPDFAATMIALANEAPPAAFLETALSRPEPAGRPATEPASALPLVAAAEHAMQPARVAGETTSGVQVAAPLHENPVLPAQTPSERTEPRTADVIPFPTVAFEPPVGQPTEIVVGGEAFAIVDASDLTGATADEPLREVEPVVVAAAAELVAPTIPVAEDDFLVVGEEALAVPQAEASPAGVLNATSDTVPVPVIAANAAVAAVLSTELPMPEVVTMMSPREAPPEASASSDTRSEPSLPSAVVEALDGVKVAAAREIAPAPQSVAATPEEPVELVQVSPDAVELKSETQPAAALPDESVDEDAAMRAIEGNWTPRRPPARQPRPVAPPEGVNQAVGASARAVTAARRTAEAVVAEVAVATAEVKAEAGRPPGLDGPRDGRKDDLTHIIGVLPVIETALNKLGLYHFDQVGSLTDEHIGWIEGHLGVPGRISRELWREQARELSAVLKPKRTAEKK